MAGMQISQEALNEMFGADVTVHFDWLRDTLVFKFVKRLDQDEKCPDPVVFMNCTIPYQRMGEGQTIMLEAYKPKPLEVDTQKLEELRKVSAQAHAAYMWDCNHRRAQEQAEQEALSSLQKWQNAYQEFREKNMNYKYNEPDAFWAQADLELEQSQKNLSALSAMEEFERLKKAVRDVPCDSCQ
jgi:cobalamin biosynthesis Mg chelatase CobN